MQNDEPQAPNNGWTTKPEMSQSEASFHETTAGIRADAEAKKQGCDPTALEALGAATCGPVEVGGIVLKPASEGTFITLRKIAAMFANYADALGLPVSADDDNPGERELYELGLASLVFADSRRVFRELNAGKLPSLMNQAMDLIFEMPMSDQVAIKEHIQSAMEEINRLSGTATTAPGKPPAPAAAPGT